MSEIFTELDLADGESIVQTKRLKQRFKRHRNYATATTGRKDLLNFEVDGLGNASSHG